MNNFSFSNIFKDKFLSNFSSIPMSTVIITMLIAFLFSLITYFVYKLTCDNVIYSKKFNTTMSLMTLITAAVVMSMQANIVVSLGMVGALSIIRFRTAIKEPKDLLFLFWAVSNGIIIGAGVYSIACVLAVILTLGLLLFEKLPENKIPYLLVVSSKSIDIEDKISEILKNNKVKFKIKSRNSSNQKVDIVYEISSNNADTILKEISKLKNIISSNIITQDGECQF
jgi:uncharacterized membrane protein YhiD involved in acid resistance